MKEKTTTHRFTNYAYAYGYLDSAVSNLAEGLELELRSKGIEIDYNVFDALEARVKAAREEAFESALKEQERLEQGYY